MSNDKRLYTSNTKEGWGKKGWDRFNELVEQEKKNRNDYEDTVRGDDDDNRIDRFDYESISSQQDKETGEGNETESNDLQWGIQIVGV